MVSHRGPTLERGALFRILTLPGIHFTAASKSPAEQSLSSGFAKSRQRLLSATSASARIAWKRESLRSGSNDRMAERVGATKYAYIS